MENQSPNTQESWRDTVVRMSRPVRYSVTAALLLLCLFLLVAAIDGMHNWGHEDTSSPATITVTGEGTATAIPDTATVTFTSTATAAAVADAETAMTKINDAALSAVEGEGVSKDDISTTDYNVNPHYEAPVCSGYYCPPSTGKASGYDVSETVTVKIKDTSKVSAVLADLAKAGVQNVSGPNYVVGDTTSVMQQARKDAISKAQADAKVLAAQLGVKLGKVSDFEDNTGSNPEPMQAKFSANAAGAAVVAPTVPAGTNTYTDNVSITYEIH